MFCRKTRWLRHGETIINLDHVAEFATNRQNRNDVDVYLNGLNLISVLHGITLADIHYFLKYGKPRKRKAAK
ncbi:MAG: hypothetical protein LBU85_09020 [Treponema sp.]|jgi:hypothetical protein|nr:hypothetical protein [Treponema sp.]